MKKKLKFNKVIYAIFTDSKTCIISVSNKKEWFEASTKILYTKISKLSFYPGTYLKLVNHNKVAKLKTYFLCIKSLKA